MQTRLITLLLTLMSVLMLGAGTYAAVLEARPFFLGGASAEEDVSTLVAATPGEVLSAEAATSVLVECYNAMQSFAGQALGTDDRQRLIQHCDSFARAVTAADPTHSYGWYIQARIAAERGAHSEFNSALTNSQRTAPWLGWVARERFDLAERHYDWLDAAALDSYEGDIGTLASNDAGMADLVATYLRDSDFRQRMAARLEQLPPDQQQHFLDAARAAADSAAPSTQSQ